MGNLYGVEGRIDEALYQFKTATDTHPAYAEAHYNLGNTYSSLDRTEDARNECRTALSLKPNFTEARRRLEE